MLRTPKNFVTLMICLFSFLTTSSIYAAKVRKVNKKRGYVYINEGSKTGFTKGSKVCFFNRKGKKVACGKIRKSKSKKSTAKVSKKRARKIRKGYVVELKSAPATKRTESEYNYALRPTLNILISGPSQHNNIWFEPPQGAGGTSETLWSVGPVTAKTSSQANFGVEAELGAFNLALGARLQMQPPAPVGGFGMWKVGQANPYSDTVIQASAPWAFYVDYFLLRFGGLNVGAGVDIESSSVTLDTYKVSEDPKTNTTTDELQFSTISSMMTISLRMPLRYHLNFGAFGFTTGATLLVPVVGSPSDTPDIPETNEYFAAVEDPALDLSTSLGHAKSPFGLEIILGAFLTL